MKIFSLCVIAAMCNAVLSFTLNGLLGIPLYLDTVFTAAICFSFGLFPSLFTAFATAAFFSFIYINLRGFPVETVWTVFAFSICVILEVLLISFFKPKIEPRKEVFLKKPVFQNFIGLCAPLLVLTALACITVSIAGGLINFIITQFEVHSPSHPEDFFKLGLLRNNVPLLATNILSRIPINIVDRFIVIFGGFGVSLVFRRLVVLPFEVKIPPAPENVMVNSKDELYHKLNIGLQQIKEGKVINADTALTQLREKHGF